MLFRVFIFFLSMVIFIGCINGVDEEKPIKIEIEIKKLNRDILDSELVGKWIVTDATKKNYWLFLKKRYEDRYGYSGELPLLKKSLNESYITILPKKLVRCQIFNDEKSFGTYSIKSNELEKFPLIHKIISKDSFGDKFIYFSYHGGFSFREVNGTLQIRQSLYYFDDSTEIYHKTYILYRKVKLEEQSISLPKIDKSIKKKDIIGHWVLNKESKKYIADYFKNPIEYGFLKELNKSKREQRMRESYVEFFADGRVEMQTIREALSLRPFYLTSWGRWSLKDGLVLLDIESEDFHKDLSFRFSKSGAETIMWYLYGFDNNRSMKFIKTNNVQQIKKIKPKIDTLKQEILIINKLEYQNQKGIRKFTWERASEYCSELSLNGYGWRLPSIEEVFKLRDDLIIDDEIIKVKQEFLDTLGEKNHGKIFWTKEQENLFYAWKVHVYRSIKSKTFIKNDKYSDKFKTLKNDVFCVRDKSII